MKLALLLFGAIDCREVKPLKSTELKLQLCKKDKPIVSTLLKPSKFNCVLTLNEVSRKLLPIETTLLIP
jgi:hypothetical protein